MGRLYLHHTLKAVVLAVSGSIVRSHRKPKEAGLIHVPEKQTFHSPKLLAHLRLPLPCFGAANRHVHICCMQLLPGLSTSSSWIKDVENPPQLQHSCTTDTVLGVQAAEWAFEVVRSRQICRKDGKDVCCSKACLLVPKASEKK